MFFIANASWDSAPAWQLAMAARFLPTAVASAARDWPPDDDIVRQKAILKNRIAMQLT
jgi:hypothetical protein